jgi:nucleoside-diphosphate-sugar epimerase
MKVCLTGSDGYIGSVLSEVLSRRGHRVLGVDSGLFSDCLIGETSSFTSWGNVQTDIRLLGSTNLAGVDAVIHLAGLSNDPLGELDPSLTRAINTQGALRTAQMARRAGAHHFVFASSCSVYGPGEGIRELTEQSPVRPLTTYAKSKVDAEAELEAMADPSFRVTAVRAATVFGMSPRLRLDLVVNELVATAAAGEVPMLRSAGTAWRPFIHVHDLANAYAEVIEGRSGGAFDVFNVGDPSATTTIVDLAATVSAVTGAKYRVASSASADDRSYRVSFAKFQDAYPSWEPSVTISEGIAQTVDGLRSIGFSSAELNSTKFRRLPYLSELIQAGQVDHQLFPKP